MRQPFPAIIVKPHFLRKLAPGKDSKFSCDTPATSAEVLFWPSLFRPDLCKPIIILTCVGQTCFGQISLGQCPGMSAFVLIHLWRCPGFSVQPTRFNPKSCSGSVTILGRQCFEIANVFLSLSSHFLLLCFLLFSLFLFVLIVLGAKFAVICDVNSH